MTDREKAIVMAYTGICMLNGDKYDIFCKYVEELMGRPVYTHELGFGKFSVELRRRATPDFIALCKDNDSAPKWIPIKERIPAPGRNILVCDSDGDIYVSYMRTDHTFGFDTSGNRIKNVVAWMWAPEPYKESEE